MDADLGSAHEIKPMNESGSMMGLYIWSEYLNYYRLIY